MSAKNRSVFTSDDRFTPLSLATALVSTLPLREGMFILEPSAGDGAFVRALHHACAARSLDTHSIMLVAVEPNADYHPLLRERFARGGFNGYVYHGTFETLDAGTFDWVIGNPPYTLAEAHARLALSIASEGVGFLLRLNFLGTEDRMAFWREHLATVLAALTERPSFSSDGGTDATEYGWYMWRQHAAFVDPFTRLFPLAWKYDERPLQVQADLERVQKAARELWSHE
jgi:methylase of polypeptide subunit release factors